MTTSLEKADETVDLRLRAAYSWLLVPVQPEPLGPIEFQASRISGDDNFYDRAARRLRNDGLLIYEWSPDILRMELDRYIWSEERGWEVGLKQLWEYLAQYCYLPRLFDQRGAGQRRQGRRGPPGRALRLRHGQERRGLPHRGRTPQPGYRLL